MKKLQISKTKDFFLCEGKPIFLLADSVWQAFSSITPEEWEFYLDYRWHQGFNAVQISVLPLTSETTDFKIAPFKINSKGNFDFYKINEDYFKKANEMLDNATKKGFIPYLAVTVCNYIPDESEAYGYIDPDTIIPMDALEPYVEYVVKTFSKFNPVFMVSEDTSFLSEIAINYYLKILEIIKKLNSEALTTMHTSVRTDSLPDKFIYSDYLDFYMYQAGHFIELQDNPYKYAQKYYNSPVKRPIINTSVCYDGHGYGYKYGRFSEFNIRKSIWQSILSGAKAGITYGAHGVWNWYIRGSDFKNISFSNIPYDWQVAIRLKGAWEATFARWIFESYDLFSIEPALLILNENESQRNEIRMSISEKNGLVIIYIPYNVDVKVNKNLRDFEFILINLSDKSIAKPRISIDKNITMIKMHDFNSDVLLIGKLN